MMLSLARKLPIIVKYDFPLDLEAYKGIELKGKTVGIIGLGHIGKAIAERCLGLGMKVTYWSHVSRDERFEYVSLKQAFKADVVIPTMSENKDTKMLISRELLQSMKLTTMFVSVVHKYYDHNLVLNMVKTGKLIGYGFESEKARDFKNYEGNIWSAPAYAWCTDTSMNNAMRLWVENMIDAAKEQYPNRVN